MFRRIVSVLKSNLFWIIVISFSVYAFVYQKFYMIETVKIDPFIVKHIVFDGNEKVKDVVLIKKLKASGFSYESSIFKKVLLDDVRENLEKVSWIKSVMVQRQLPNTINVRIVERVPIAVFHVEDKMCFVDEDGVVLEDDGFGSFNNLPIIAGEKAETDAANLIALLDKFPKIKNQMVKAVRVGKRRWNIIINKGLVVKLPEKRELRAFNILDTLSDSNGFLKDDMLCLDLRLDDRIIVSKNKMSNKYNSIAVKE